MKADGYRDIAEFSEGDPKAKAAEKARLAYEEAQTFAMSVLVVTHPIRLGPALNYSVLQHEVLNTRRVEGLLPADEGRRPP